MQPSQLCPPTHPATGKAVAHGVAGSSIFRPKRKVMRPPRLADNEEHPVESKKQKRGQTERSGTDQVNGKYSRCTSLTCCLVCGCSDEMTFVRDVGC